MALRPFLQPESPLSLRNFSLQFQVQIPVFEPMTPCWEANALAPRLYTIHIHEVDLGPDNEAKTFCEMSRKSVEG